MLLSFARYTEFHPSINRPPHSPSNQDPIADRLVLPYALDACDMMVYIEDDEYWDLALSRTEHFLFHRLRALRRLLCREDVYSLSPDGSKLTQRTYHETKTRCELHIVRVCEGRGGVCVAVCVSL